MTGYPFQGRIFISGYSATTLSAFAETSWDIDADTMPAQTPMAFKETAWDTDSDDAETNVYGFKSTTDWTA